MADSGDGYLHVFGALGQINSWLVGPIYMLQEASREDNLLGDKIAQLHPVWKTPAFALMVQAIIVTVLCFSTFISPSVAAAYWMLTALTTITYFIPYGDVPRVLAPAQNAA